MDYIDANLLSCIYIIIGEIPNPLIWDGLNEPTSSITTTVRKKRGLKHLFMSPVHALDSFAALPFAKRFPAKN